MKFFKKVFTTILLSTLLITSLTGCDTKGSNHSENSNSPSDDILSIITQSDNNEQFISEIFSPSKRTLWYFVDSIDKNTEVEHIMILENETLTWVDSELSLGDVANMSDDEVYQMVYDSINVNNHFFYKYDTSNLQIILKTDNTGNKVIQETIVLPFSSTISFRQSDDYDNTKYLGMYFDYKTSDSLNNEKAIPGTIKFDNYGAIYSSYFAGFTSGEYKVITKVPNKSTTFTYFTDNFNKKMEPSSILMEGNATNFIAEFYRPGHFKDSFILEITTPDGRYYFDNVIYNSRDEYIYITEENSLLPWSDSLDEDYNSKTTESPLNR